MFFKRDRLDWNRSRKSNTPPLLWLQKTQQTVWKRGGLWCREETFQYCKSIVSHPYLQPCMQDMYGNLQSSPRILPHVWKAWPMVLSSSNASPLPPPPFSSAISKAWVCKKPHKCSLPWPPERCKDCGQKCKTICYCVKMDASLTAIFNQFFYCFKKEKKIDKKRLTEPDFRLYLFPPVHNV